MHPGKDAEPARRSRPLPWVAGLLFLAALAVRLPLLTTVRSDLVIPHTRWEMEAIAWSLAETGRFADPYAVPTGPTAHLPPAYPFLLSLVWRAFGLGPAGGYAGWIMGFTLASLQCALLPWISMRLGLGLAAGVIVGLVTAFSPQWPPFIEPPTAIALGLLMLAFRRRWMAGAATTTDSLLLGAGAGLAFHLQPALLPVVLACLAFELWWLCSAPARFGRHFGPGWRSQTVGREVGKQRRGDSGTP